MNHIEADAEGVSRRGFLKGAAGAGLIAAAGAALAGCASDASGSAKSASKEDEAKAAFEAETAPIDPVEVPESWDDEADVVVVGSGAGGLIGSIRLADEDKKVILLEKDVEKTGGSSRYSGYFANLGGHRYANEVEWAFPSYPYDPKKVVEYLNNAWQQSADADMLYAAAVEGPKCIDWMEDALGVPWAPLTDAAPFGAQWLYWDGNVTPKNAVLINDKPFDAFTDMAKQRGVDIRLGNEVKALVVDNGAVVGVKVQTANAEQFIKAKAVLLTAGGFEMNRAMLKKYLPTCYEGMANVACPPCNTGECICMGLGVGANIVGLDSGSGYDGGVWWRDYEEYETRMEAHINKDGNQGVRQPWLRINSEGNRVPYLGTTYSPYPYKPAGEEMVYGLNDQMVVEIFQPQGKTFVCFDSKYEELVTSNYFQQGVCRVGKIIPEDDPLIDRVPEWQRDWRTGFNMMVDAGAVKKCDTIEELEQALGLREGLLVEAVKKWNAACEAGEDYMEMYPYDPSWLIPISEPPYYGAAVGGHIFATNCGLKVNTDMQVVNTDGEVIPGLYAGWHTAGGCVGEMNPAGRPFNGMYGLVGQSFVGGYMAAGGILAADSK